MEMRVCVEHLDLFLSDSNLEDGVTQVVKAVRPEWPEINIKRKVFTDGFSNRLFGAYLDNSSNDMILIRVYGENTELFIDREREVWNMQTLHKSKLIPPVYCTFNNGLCYGYSPGVVLNENMVRDPIISSLISQMFVRMHVIRPELKNPMLEPEPCLIKDLRKFLELIPNDLKDSQQNERFKEVIPNREGLISEVNSLELDLKRLSSPVVFCHNDLSIKNIIFDSDILVISFIDFEYSDYNYLAFDIANHFCEFGGVETFNPSLYPDKEFQIQWLRHYLEAGFALNGRSLLTDSIEKSSIEADVENLYNQVNRFSLASHLYWGVWAVVQTQHSAISADFLGYAIKRFREYYKRKDDLLLTDLNGD